MSGKHLPPSHLPEWHRPATPPRLPADEVHVWRFTLERRVGKTERELLDPSERARLARIKHPDKRRHYEVVRIAARTLLGCYLDRNPGTLRFAAGIRGKPSLIDADGLEFNLSDCADLGLLAVARGRAVGVDLERLRAIGRSWRIAERMFAPVNLDWLRALGPEERREGFFRAWTEMEAGQKVTGAGLFGPRPPAGRIASRPFVPAAGYVATLAWDGPAGAVAPRYYLFEPGFEPGSEQGFEPAP